MSGSDGARPAVRRHRREHPLQPRRQARRHARWGHARRPPGGPLPDRRRRARRSSRCPDRSSRPASTASAGASSTSWPRCASASRAARTRRPRPTYVALDGAPPDRRAARTTSTSTSTRSTTTSTVDSAAMVWLVRAVGPRVERAALARLLRCRRPGGGPRRDRSGLGRRRARRCSTPPRWSGRRRAGPGPASAGCPVVLSCTGDTMPTDAPERIDARDGHHRARAREGSAARATCTSTRS